jgi:hypothetical protein
VYCVVDLSEEYVASILTLEVTIKVVTGFGWGFLIHTIGVDNVELEIFPDFLRFSPARNWICYSASSVVPRDHLPA